MCLVYRVEQEKKGYCLQLNKEAGFCIQINKQAEFGMQLDLGDRFS